MSDPQRGYRPHAAQLTTKQVRDAKPQPDTYRLSDGRGLYLEITTTGLKNWRTTYTVNNRKSKRLLGTYPAMSLEQARAARAALRCDVAQGAHPNLTERAAVQQRKDTHTHTLERMAREWHARKATTDWSPSYADQTLQRLTAHVFPAIGQMPIATVRRGHIATLLHAAITRSGKHQANNTRKNLSSLFDDLVAQDLLEANPTSGLRKAIKLPRSEEQPAALTIEDARDVLRRFEASACSPMLKLLHRFGALTGLRPSEVRGARWDEIQGATWRVPAERMKGPRGQKVPHTVFLAPQALEVLAVARELAPPGAVYIFPGHIQRTHQPYGRVTLTRQLTLVLGSGVHVAHGWRATMATLMSTLHPAHADLLQMMIGHRVQSTLARRYNRADEIRYEPQMRPLAREWADLLLHGAPPAAALIGRRTADVVPLLPLAA